MKIKNNFHNKKKDNKNYKTYKQQIDLKNHNPAIIK